MMDLFRSRPRSRTGPARRSRPCLPHMELLEAREVPSTFTVENLNDAGPGSLRQAILQANANPGADTVAFARGLRGTIALSSQLLITDRLSILGPGADALTVSGGTTTRVFGVLPAALAANPLTTPSLAQLATAPEVSLLGLTIANGRATNALGFNPADPGNPGFAFGGGLFNLGGTVRLDQVHMIGNTASNVVTAGGAVANEFGGTVAVTRSYFARNTSGGGLIGAGGAITSDLGPTTDGPPTGRPTLTVDRSLFTDNTARSQAGYIDGVAFSGLGAGGAILSLTGSLRITESEFRGNSAHGGPGGTPGAIAGGPALGGAVSTGDASPFGVANSTLDLRDNVFVENTVTGGAGGAAGLPGGEAGGGAVAASNGTDAILRGNSFRENRAVGGQGGADADGGVATGGAVAGMAGAALTLERNTFRRNTAVGGAGPGTGMGGTGRGGGLGLGVIALAGFFPDAPTAAVSRDLYEANVARGIGGGIYNIGRLTVAQSVVRDNRSVGEADTVAVGSRAFQLLGGAIGGGVANFGALTLRGTDFFRNQALGADDADSGDNSFAEQEPVFAGNSFGGAVAGYGGTATTAIEGGFFLGNVARAGDRGRGEFAAIAGGGALANDSRLTVRDAEFVGNRAVAGNEAVSPFHNGHALGGAINSGSLLPAFGGPGATLEVSRCLVVDNQSLGGNRNRVTLSEIPRADGPNNGYGGGILVYQGEAALSLSTVASNRAAGGAGGTRQNGSLGVGGGIFFFSFLGRVTATMDGTLVAGNVAVGGAGIAGVPGFSPDGGAGLGGGIASGTLDSPFGMPGTLQIEDSLVADNLAQGGSRASGGTGGNGLGGGLYNDTGAELALVRSLVFANRARGGPGGEGIGGGLYNNGGMVDLVNTLIFANSASTRDDDCFGCP